MSRFCDNEAPVPGPLVVTPSGGGFVGGSFDVSADFDDGGGTGVLLSEDGFILTNYHVVEQVIENQKYGKLYGFTSGTPHPKIGVISGQQILAQVVQKLVIDDMSPEEAAAWGQAEMEKAVKK